MLRTLMHHPLRLAGFFLLAILLRPAVAQEALSGSSSVSGSVGGVIKVYNSTGQVRALGNALVELYVGQPLLNNAAADSATHASPAPTPPPGGRWFVRTTAQGSFAIERLAAGEYSLVVTASGLAAQQRRIVVQRGVRTVVEITMGQPVVTTPETGKIQGVVTRSQGGQPIAGAQVFVSSLGQPEVEDDGSVDCPQYTLTTNAQGVYQVAQLPPGSYHLSVRARGFNATQADVAVVAGETALQDFALATLGSANPGQISGRVYDAVTSTPLAGARVYYHRVPGSPVVLDDRVPPAERARRMPVEQPDYAVADQAGQYSIPDLTPGRYHLLGTETTYRDCETIYLPQPRSVVLAEAEQKIVDFPLRRRPDPTRGALEGTVIDALNASGSTANSPTSHPLEGVQVLVVPAGDRSELLNRPQVVYGDVLTDAAGRFRVNHLPPGPCEVIALKDGYRRARQNAIVPAGAVGTTLVRMQRIPVETVGTLTGLVRGATDNQPLGGVMITLIEATSQTARLSHPPNEPLRRVTAADGTFTFEYLTAGSYRLYAAHPAYKPLRESLVVVTSTTTEVNLTLTARQTHDADGEAGIVAGVIVDSATSAPLAGALVKLVLEDASQITHRSFVKLADAQGRFRFERVPAGAARVAAGKVGYSPAQCAVDVVADQTASVKLGLVKITATGVLEGQVLDALTSAPLRGASVSLAISGLPESGYAVLATCVRTDADGRYRMTGVPAQRQVVVAQQPGYWTDAQAVDVNAETTATLDFRLLPVDEAASTVTVKVVDARTGKVVPLAAVQLQLSPWQVPGLTVGMSNTWCDLQGLATVQVPEGTWPLSASSPGYLPSNVSIEGSSDTKAASQVVTLQLMLDMSQNAAQAWELYQ